MGSPAASLTYPREISGDQIQKRRVDSSRNGISIDSCALKVMVGKSWRQQCRIKSLTVYGILSSGAAASAKDLEKVLDSDVV
jgi:hypothetical protein